MFLKNLLLTCFLACALLLLPSLSESAESDAAQKPLIVYFSQSGNTRQLAEMIQKLTNGRLLEIKTQKKYPDSYNALTEEAKKEIEDKVRPPLSMKLENPDLYSAIFLGFPNWWSSVPMPVWTFIEENKINGKTIIPFVTHGGGNMGHIMSDLKELCPNSKILEPFYVSGSKVRSSQSALEKWVKSLPADAIK